MKVRFGATDIYVATPEDTVVSKMLWAREAGTSGRQLEDAAGVVRVCGSILDRTYIEVWAKRLGLDELWERVQQQAAE